MMDRKRTRKQLHLSYPLIFISILYASTKESEPSKRLPSMMTKSPKVHLFLVLLLVAGSPSLINAKENILTQIGNTIMTDPSNADDVHLEDYDAATGTVRDKAPRDNSCDGQLTRDLIRTTERLSKTQKSLEEESSKHKSALETIVELQMSLAKTNTDFVNEKEAKLELQASMDSTIETAVLQTKKDMEELKTKSKDDLEALRKEKDTLIAELNEESTFVLESLRATAHKEFQQLKTEKDEMIAALESKLKMSTDQLQETMKLELEKAKKDKENLVSELSAEKQATVERMTLAMDKASTEASEKLEKATKETEAAVASLQAERAKQVESLQALMEKEVSERNTEIESLRDMKEKLKQIIATHEQALEAANSVRTNHDSSFDPTSDSEHFFLTLLFIPFFLAHRKSPNGKLFTRHDRIAT